MESLFEHTPYGIKMTGSYPLIIIAPHAAGDDLKTGIFAKKLATSLGAFLLVNNKYKKPANSKTSLHFEYSEDFNKLSWSEKKQKYRWKNKKSDMRLFYDDLKIFTENARKFSSHKKVLSIHIHGMKPQNGIDIGAGVKFHPKTGTFQNSYELKNHTKNSGSETIPLSKLKHFYKTLSQNIPPEFGPITIGKFFPGWSRYSGVQWHKHNQNEDEALNFEIGKNLRLSKNNRNKLIHYLSSFIKNTLV